MPMISFLCETCGPFEKYRPVTSVEVPPCLTCGGPATRHWIPSYISSSPAAVVVYRAPDGSFRYPGSGDGLYAQKCEKDGLTRVELRGWAEVRRFERLANQQERMKVNHRVERQQQATEAAEKHRRSDLFQKMGGMSNFGRDVARAAIAINNRKPSVRSYDPGFHVSCYSESRGDRDESRDAQGRKRRD